VTQKYYETVFVRLWSDLK